MACVILPSETARLVYGYLIKENLNDIALQFLEKSPYLTDCCQIVRSGYQFNTKLMGKELQDLLQEYSVIHNLANKKVNLLCKTSLLYKRIKLKCESLSEILELILFWKYRQPQNEVSSLTSEKSTKTLSVSEFRNSNDSVTNKIGIPSADLNSSFSDSSSLFAKNDSCSVQNKSVINKLEVLKKSFSNEISDKTLNSSQSGLHSEKFMELQETNQCSNQIKINQNVHSPASNPFLKHPCGNVNSIVEDKAVTNGNSCNISINNSNDYEMPELCLKTSVLTINMNSHEKKLASNKIADEQREPNSSSNNYESQFKIVGVQKDNQKEENVASSFSINTNQTDTTLEDGSVVYVNPEIGNLAIDQEKNQIIVIPIDYYKTQNEIQSNVKGSDCHIKNDFYAQKKPDETPSKSNMMYDGILQSEENSIPQFCSEDATKITRVDSNIMTENDFLKSKHLIFNLNKDFIEKSENQPSFQMAAKVEKETTSVTAVPAPLIVLSQTVLPNPTTSRFRSILPKKKNESAPSVVLVQPLLESTQGVLKKTNQVDENKKTRNNFKSKKKVFLLQKGDKDKVQSEKFLDMPTIKTPSADKLNEDESKAEKNGVEELKSAEAYADNIVQKNSNEEKENLDKAEEGKTETPAIVTRRNSKRLSLSTPRRRSHVRALEFETPPKRKEEKKSRTSPKAKVDQVTVERKSVRNTLFKSPVSESSFKSVENSTKKNNKKNTKKEAFENNESSPKSTVKPLSELSIPIATRSPNAKLSDAWENLTGVGCVIGQPQSGAISSSKKMWDADLRCFLKGNTQEPVEMEKKRVRKPVKVHKNSRKNIKKKLLATKKSRTVSTTISPSKMSLTSKRNTYSINGNEEGSPLKSLLDDLKLVTPFKDIETIRASEETPLTKLLRENINTIDIDLSMINTPSFPPTPSILITPDLDDVSLPGANYYSPSKDLSKEKVMKITDYIRVNGEKTNKKDSKETHEKVIDDLVSKAKEIIGIGKVNQEESAVKRRPSGKILSMVKIQMLTQCDKKLCENIPINEDGNFTNGTADQLSSLSNANEDTVKSDLKEELEEKRKRALKKIKIVKENLSRTKNKVVKRSQKRKRSENSSGNSSSEKKLRKIKRTETENETGNHGQMSLSDESDCKKIQVFHSTPYDAKKNGKFTTSESDKKEKYETLSDIRQQLPAYTNNDNSYPQLTEKSRKKIHYVGHFLKLKEIVKFLEKYDETNPPKLYLKPSFRRFFQVFYKWLKHPHKHELNASAETKNVLKIYLTEFEKINVGINQREKTLKECKEAEVDSARVAEEEDDEEEEEEIENGCLRVDEKIRISDEEDKDWKPKEVERKKDEDTEDGFMSILPLKKRKQTVQRVEVKSALPSLTSENKSDFPKVSRTAENVSQTQNFLQDIDVDRFLSQIHGQSNR